VYTPLEFNNIMLEGFQAVLNGDRTPQEQAEALQAAWDAYYNK
jgi:ABC-type glycerol-3-phosphate transport system substrate-binding protein